MTAVTYPVCLFCGLVTWWQQCIAAGISWGRAAGCGIGSGGGAWAANMLLWIMGVAALRGLRATFQKRITISTPRSRPRTLTSPALQAGPTPHHACSGWALASCRRNHRSREDVRVRTTRPWGILGGTRGSATCWHHRGRWGWWWGSDGGAREGETFTLLLEQLLQTMAKKPHARPGVLAHLNQGRVIWLGKGPLQTWALWPPCHRTWTGSHPLWLHLTFLPLLHISLLTLHE